MLKKYQAENCNFSQNYSTGFTKNMGSSVAAPSKDGVAAPKKG